MMIDTSPKYGCSKRSLYRGAGYERLASVRKHCPRPGNGENAGNSAYNASSGIRVFILLVPFVATACAHPDLAAILACPPDQAENPPLSSSVYHDDSIADLKTLASDGDLAAARVIGERYETGDGVAADIKEAIGWYQRAAFKPPAITTVYMPGYGKTPGSTIPITVGPATPGDLVAMAHLAHLYLIGRGLPEDDARGQRLLACAAAHGVATNADPASRGGQPTRDKGSSDHG
jgi:hypothetical protein